ncbi:hypothetical protein HanHA300_Chr14g0539991 [Helianthus annuus]|nr:hypothetical protein HanHA300_Chr14g0539991 [Helianthus annuus]KAJ0487189.1 hypothetical protein HanHA89_Chr14g0587761 [Helianthus annuus]
MHGVAHMINQHVLLEAPPMQSMSPLKLHQPVPVALLPCRVSMPEPYILKLMLLTGSLRLSAYILFIELTCPRRLSW